MQGGIDTCPEYIYTCGLRERTPTTFTVSLNIINELLIFLRGPCSFVIALFIAARFSHSFGTHSLQRLLELPKEILREKRRWERLKQGADSIAREISIYRCSWKGRVPSARTVDLDGWTGGFGYLGRFQIWECLTVRVDKLFPTLVACC